MKPRKKNIEALKKQAAELFAENPDLCYQIARLIELDDLKNDISDQIAESFDGSFTSDDIEAIAKLTKKKLDNMSTDERYYLCIDEAIVQYTKEAK